ncbi:MAG: energy-coupling factor transporter transmembrane component T [Oscillospiraceae bacterium]|nr:energy-coupling factor transporter transmembrane component T [Oscillospiraceae bacterium]
MKDTFSGLHPIVNFTYFTAVILFSMFFMHPVFLGFSLVSALIYSIYLNGIKAAKFNFLYMLPLLLLVALINPLFNHEGVTILLFINDNPITYESIIYGIASATMFISVIIWFSCYNSVVTSDKFIYLFGKIIPSLSLILSMTLRFVPKFKAQIKVISNAQKCIGRDVSNGNVLQRARNGIKIISILITWALENSIETADSMKCRGYGLKGRTSFSNYRFDKRDKSVLGTICGLILLMIFGMVLGENTIDYFPSIIFKEITIISAIVYIGYAALLLIPVALNIMEDIKWYHLKSKI